MAASSQPQLVICAIHPMTTFTSPKLDEQKNSQPSSNQACEKSGAPVDGKSAINT